MAISMHGEVMGTVETCGMLMARKKICGRKMPCKERSFLSMPTLFFHGTGSNANHKSLVLEQHVIEGALARSEAVDRCLSCRTGQFVPHIYVSFNVRI